MLYAPCHDTESTSNKQDRIVLKPTSTLGAESGLSNTCNGNDETNDADGGMDASSKSSPLRSEDSLDKGINTFDSLGTSDSANHQVEEICVPECTESTPKTDINNVETIMTTRDSTKKTSRLERYNKRDTWVSALAAAERHVGDVFPRGQLILNDVHRFKLIKLHRMAIHG